MFMYAYFTITCIYRVSERPTSEEKSGVDLLGFLKGYGFIHDKLMEPHINRCNDDPVSILVHVHVYLYWGWWRSVDQSHIKS